MTGKIIDFQQQLKSKQTEQETEAVWGIICLKSLEDATQEVNAAAAAMKQLDNSNKAIYNAIKRLGPKEAYILAWQYKNHGENLTRLSEAILQTMPEVDQETEAAYKKEILSRTEKYQNNNLTFFEIRKAAATGIIPEIRK